MLGVAGAGSALGSPGSFLSLGLQEPRAHRNLDNSGTTAPHAGD
jgi:hypothetical protein